MNCRRCGDLLVLDHETAFATCLVCQADDAAKCDLRLAAEQVRDESRRVPVDPGPNARLDQW